MPDREEGRAATTFSITRGPADVDDGVWAYHRYYANQPGVEFDLLGISAAAKHLAAMIRKRCPIVGLSFPFHGKTVGRRAK
jgi:hypothetical protein